MAIQTKRIYHGTTTDLHTLASTAAVATDDMSVESAALTSSETTDYPMGEFELDVDFTTAPTANKTIDLYERGQDIAGSVKSPEPSTTFKQKRVASFKPDAVTGSQILKEDARLVKNATYYLFNNNTGQSMPAAAWGLKVRPFGHGS